MSGSSTCRRTRVFVATCSAQLNETCIEGFFRCEAPMVDMDECAKCEELCMGEQVTYECLMRAIAAVKPGMRYREVGDVISSHASRHGYSVVRSYCGHGIGDLFHCSPTVPHFARNKAKGIMQARPSSHIRLSCCQHSGRVFGHLVPLCMHESLSRGDADRCHSCILTVFTKVRSAHGASIPLATLRDAGRRPEEAVGLAFAKGHGRARRIRQLGVLRQWIMGVVSGLGRWQVFHVRVVRHMVSFCAHDCSFPRPALNDMDNVVKMRRWRCRWGIHSLSSR
jgi:hypothetical protein